ncbi:hypothetical protein [Rhodovulum adriaticum]|uniref:Uncharacterized protein n=1 Tax=Rhodovulum adriaticum TaxID=35804 RepID=A0A4R2NKZ0_RHOAD|nr:hypothetical protein [Rhodovulum adriaticum]MBK1637018.1 hypothetical protein [Rhodovulum adriaticum]TCP21998.1 hypothetical protein EV656_10844 [Rhodovulum adriaticum]
MDRPLSPPERALLAVIQQVEAETGRIERDVLSVRAKGRGLEVTRTLAQLVQLGLVEKVQRRPSFLGRLFGGRPVDLLQLTAAGRAAAEQGAPATAAAQPDPAVPEDADDTETAPGEEPPAPPAETPPAAPAAPVTPPATEPPADSPAAPAPQAPPVAKADAPPADAVETPPAAPAPRPKRPDRAQALAYTEDLGGAPLPEGGVALTHDVDPEVMEGIREVLAGFGMDLTFAGEAFIGARIAQGHEAGDALCQVVLFAFAHAVRDDLASDGALSQLGLGDYAAEIAEELGKLHAAGLIGAERLEQDRSRLIALADAGADRASIVEDILSDPVGGLLPPAALPEELRPAQEA